METVLKDDVPVEGRQAGLQECPVCGHLMPDLRGGDLSICQNCGFKDDCC